MHKVDKDHPAACPKCGCCLYWQDGYGGYHCGECETAPSPSMVVCWWVIRDCEDDTHELVTYEEAYREVHGPEDVRSEIWGPQPTAAIKRT